MGSEVIIGEVLAKRIYELTEKLIGEIDANTDQLIIDNENETDSKRIPLATLLSFLGSNFSDADFTLFNSVDSTKQLQFLLSSITAGITRTLTIQNKDYTIAGLDDLIAENLETSETNTALVLSPDGVGGVEFRAESGGGGGVSEYDATVGASGADYTTLNAAYAAGKYNLLAVDTFSLSADLTLTSDYVAINLNNQTFNAGAFGIIAGNYGCAIYGVGTIVFAYAANKLFISGERVGIIGEYPRAIIVDNNSTVTAGRIADDGVMRNLEVQLPNISAGGFGYTGTGFNGILEEIYFVGGGASCNYAIRSDNGNNGQANKIFFSGTYASTFVFSVAFWKLKNVEYLATNTSTAVIGNGENILDLNSRLTVRVFANTTYNDGILKDSVVGSCQLYANATIKNCRFANAVSLSLSNSYSNLKAIDCIFESTLTVGTSSIPLAGVNIHVEGCTIDGAAVFALDEARIRNNKFNSTFTLESGSGLNMITDNEFVGVFTDNSGVLTNLFANNQGADDIRQNALQLTDLAGTGSRFVEVDADGNLTATETVITGKLSDSTAISNLTNASNWTGVNYTGTAITGTFEGQYYDDGTYYYYAYSDNDWRRLARA